MKSRTDNELPSRAAPYTEHVDPILTNVRMLMFDPTCPKSRIDIVDPIFTMPYTDSVEPMRMKERQLIPDPTETASRIEQELPSRLTP
jgi:hypothetical protein